jgi:hypothetical protein
MLERIGSVERIPQFIAGVKAKKEKLFGFGHRVYKNFDPRATIIRKVSRAIGWAAAQEQAMRWCPFFYNSRGTRAGTLAPAWPNHMALAQSHLIGLMTPTAFLPVLLLVHVRPCLVVDAVKRLSGCYGHSG